MKKWWFPERGVPLNHPINMILHYTNKPSTFGNPPFIIIYGNPQKRKKCEGIWRNGQSQASATTTWCLKSSRQRKARAIGRINLITFSLSASTIAMNHSRFFPLSSSSLTSGVYAVLLFSKMILVPWNASHYSTGRPQHHASCLSSDWSRYEANDSERKPTYPTAP